MTRPRTVCRRPGRRLLQRMLPDRRRRQTFRVGEEHLRRLRVAGRLQWTESYRNYECASHGTTAVLARTVVVGVRFSWHCVTAGWYVFSAERCH